MEKGRYIAGIVLGALAAVAFVWLTKSSGENDVGLLILLGYITLSTVTSLIWWQGLPARIFYTLTIVVGLGSMQIAFSLWASGSIILIVLGIVLLAATFSFSIGCIGAGFGLAAIVSFFTFPFALVSNGKNLY